MVAPAEKPVIVTNAVCPRCDAHLLHTRRRGTYCSRPGCPGPRAHPLAALFARPGKPAR